MTSPINNLSLRFAKLDDAETICNFIHLLADYEELSHEAKATPEAIKEMIFEKQYAEVLLAEIYGKTVGFALFFHNFSTFLAKPGLYLEDLFVLPEMRKLGIGKAIFSKLITIAKERNCGRMEWVCLDWNQNSIDFYESIGAKSVNGWHVYRLTGEKLANNRLLS